MVEDAIRSELSRIEAFTRNLRTNILQLLETMTHIDQRTMVIRDLLENLEEQPHDQNDQ